MKYLLNLPLALAALLQVWFASLVFMSAPWSGWGDGPSRGAMVLVMLEPAVFCWLLLLLAMVGAAFTDAFDWLPVGRRWLRRLLVVGAALVTVALAVPCVATAIGSSAAVADRDTAEFSPLLVTGAMVVAVAVPFALAGWLAWLIDAPSPWRDALWPRGIGLGALALLLLIGSPLGGRMLAEEIRTELATSRRYQQEIDERETARTADFAQLTDASPLHSWGAYATDELDLKERRDGVAPAGGSSDPRGRSGERSGLPLRPGFRCCFFSRRARPVRAKRRLGGAAPHRHVPNRRRDAQGGLR
jgi:hypothetical protein